MKATALLLGLASVGAAAAAGLPSTPRAGGLMIGSHPTRRSWVRSVSSQGGGRV